MCLSTILFYQLIFYMQETDPNQCHLFISYIDWCLINFKILYQLNSFKWDDFFLKTFDALTMLCVIHHRSSKNKWSVHCKLLHFKMHVVLYGIFLKKVCCLWWRKRLWCGTKLSCKIFWWLMQILDLVDMLAPLAWAWQSMSAQIIVRQISVKNFMSN